MVKDGLVLIWELDMNLVPTLILKYLCKLIPCKLVVPNLRNSQIRYLENYSLNLQSRTPKLADFAGSF